MRKIKKRNLKNRNLKLNKPIIPKTDLLKRRAASPLYQLAAKIRKAKDPSNNLLRKRKKVKLHKKNENL